jgi:hypothetical protein
MAEVIPIIANQDQLRQYIAYSSRMTPSPIFKTSKPGCMHLLISTSVLLSNHPDHPNDVIKGGVVAQRRYNSFLSFQNVLYYLTYSPDRGVENQNGVRIGDHCGRRISKRDTPRKSGGEGGDVDEIAWRRIWYACKDCLLQVSTFWEFSVISSNQSNLGPCYGLWSLDGR